MADSQYLALYRKYRPQTFDDVCGRDAIVQTLKNQIVHKRVGHSYLFCGTRGTGKTTIAKIFARAVNCENTKDGNPCGTCECCRAILNDADLNVTEMDAASHNGVDDIRAVIEQAQYPPTLGKYRVFIIDEAHMLSSAAFNALLKTLEEAPSHVIFILCTTEPNKLPATILSRCQRYDFGRMSPSVIKNRLKTVCNKEGIHVEEQALDLISSSADGSMRDGLSILDQCSSLSLDQGILTAKQIQNMLGAVDTEVFHQFFVLIHEGNTKGALDILDSILEEGRDLVQFIADVIQYLRNVMLLKASEDTAPSLDVSEDVLSYMIEDARSAELSEIIRDINIFSSLTEQIRYSSNRRVLTEAAIVRICEPSMDIGKGAQEKIVSLENRVRALEDRLLALSSREPVSLTEEKQNRRTDTDDIPVRNTEEKENKEPFKTVTVQLQKDKEENKEGIRKQDAVKQKEVDWIVRNWGKIVSEIPPEEHFVKICLQKATPHVEEDGGLLITFDGFLEADCFIGKESQSSREFFQKYVEQAMGKAIPIRYKYLDRGRKFQENEKSVGSQINADAVQMEIEEEDT